MGDAPADAGRLWHRCLIAVFSAPILDLPVAVSLAGKSPGIAAASPSSVASSRTVTLITGDRVTVAGSGRGGATVRAPAGREHVAFVTQRAGGHTYVMPGDMLSPLATGGLDRRLFDASSLPTSGCDDAASADTPLIVQYASVCVHNQTRVEPPGSSICQLNGPDAVCASKPTLGTIGTA